MDLREVVARKLLDDLLVMREKADEVAAELAYQTGFQRKRAHALDIGDEIAHGDDWRLVVGVHEGCMADGSVATAIELAKDPDTPDDTDVVFADPADIYDVKAVYVEEPF